MVKKVNFTTVKTSEWGGPGLSLNKRVKEASQLRGDLGQYLKLEGV